MSVVRKQVYITDDQERRLKRRAEVERRSEAELFREALDLLLARGLAGREAAHEARARQLRLMEERARIKVPQHKRDWTREDLYEERLSRRH